MNEPDNEPKHIDAELEVVSVSALEAITRGEIDIQIATAKKFPRSIELFKKRAIEMACIDEETAASCLYARPVGKDPETGKQKIAEGLSVRMAEIVAACFGNIRFGSMIIEMTPRMVKARGMAHDLEANSAGHSEVIEVTVKKPRAGQKEGDPYDERMRAVIGKAALAKARRDAIFQVVPKALAKPIEAAVKKLLAGDEKSLSRRRGIVMKWIAELGIEPARVFAVFEIAGEADLTTDILDKLTGLRTAIKDQDITVDEAFPPLMQSGRAQGTKESPKPGTGTQGAVSTPTEEAESTLAGQQGAATAPVVDDPMFSDPSKKVETPAAKETPKKAEPKPKAEPKKEEPKKEPAAKGPSEADLRKKIVATITAQNIGKSRLMSHLIEKKVFQAGATWDQLKGPELQVVHDRLDQTIKEIRA